MSSSCWNTTSIRNLNRNLTKTVPFPRLLIASQGRCFTPSFLGIDPILWCLPTRIQTRRLAFNLHHTIFKASCNCNSYLEQYNGLEGKAVSFGPHQCLKTFGKRKIISLSMVLQSPLKVPSFHTRRQDFPAPEVGKIKGRLLHKIQPHDELDLSW